MDEFNVSPTPAVAPAEEKAPVAVKQKENKRLFLFGLLGFIGLAVILTGLIGIYRVYAQTASDKFTRAVATVLRLPALKVNGRTILYGDYLDDVKAIKTLRDYEKANGGGQTTGMTDDQLSDQVLWRFANNILFDDLARQNGVTADNAEIDKFTENLLQQFSTPAQADQELAKRYGWNMAAYRDKVIAPFVLQNKLEEKLRADLLKKATSVLNQIKAGADFSEMAKKYSEDSTAANGGDLGWFAKGDMVTEFESAVWNLKKGELAPTIVETQYGYHIIKLNDRRTTPIKDAKGKTTMTEQVSAQHIIFRFPAVSKPMNAAVDQAEFHLYLRVHNPFVKEAATPAASAATSTGQGGK